MDDWVTVYSACTASQVYIFKAALEEADIPTVVENEALQGAYGGLLGTTLSSMDPQLKVPQDKESEARAIIDNIINAPDDEACEEESQE